MYKLFSLGKYKCTACKNEFNYPGYSGGFNLSSYLELFNVIEFCPYCQKKTKLLHVVSKKDKIIIKIGFFIVILILLFGIYINIK